MHAMTNVQNEKKSDHKPGRISHTQYFIYYTCVTSTRMKSSIHIVTFNKVYQYKNYLPDMVRLARDRRKACYQRPYAITLPTIKRTSF